MSRTTGIPRKLLSGMALVALLAGCQSVPDQDFSIPPTSSLLAVDVLFPVRLGRDPSLVQAFFVRGPVHDGTDELPELIPATFVKWSRAYLLAPEPGTYSLVAVTAEYDPPWNLDPIAGVTDTVASGISTDAIIFPAALIERTTTTVAPGGVVFMGILRLRRGDHINAHAVPRDGLQKRIAERVRPGVTSESGLRGWLKRTRVVDLEETSLGNQPSDRESFLVAALADLGASPWAGVVAREAASSPTRLARPGTPTPRIENPAKRPASHPATRPAKPAVKREVKSEADGAAPSPAPIPEAAAAESQAPVAEPQAEAAEVEATVAEAAVAPPEPEPEPLPVAPTPQPLPGIPPDSLLARIELGMKHDEVRRILGSPDGRIDRLTAKAWIPFYDGPDANLRDWIYEGSGRVVFSLYKGTLRVIDVVYDPNQRK